jgi:hypothetical protein
MMRRKIWAGSFVLITAAVVSSNTAFQDRATNDHFDLHFGPSGISSLKRSPLRSAEDFISPGGNLGDIVLKYRMLNQEWQDFVTAGMDDVRTIKQAGRVSPTERIIVYNGSGWYDYFADLEFTCRLRMQGDTLYWTLHLRNVTHKPVEIANFYLPLPFSTDVAKESVVLIAGHASFLTWKTNQDPRGSLVMTPIEKCPLFEPAQTERNFAPVALEGADDRGIYIHSARVDAASLENRSGGNLPRTSHLLTPKFTPGDEITYGFKFRWADDDEEVRRILYEEGLFDIRISPGETIAAKETVTLTLRSKNVIRSIEPEYPNQTVIQDSGRGGQDTHTITVEFERPGKNLLAFGYNGDRKLYLVFDVVTP